MSQSHLPIGSRQHTITHQASRITHHVSLITSGTGGGIRTLINWFLRPVPLPGWATPAHSNIAWLSKKTTRNSHFETRNSVWLSKNKGASPFRTQSAKAARSLFLFFRTGLEILGAGSRSRWINAAVVNNRRTYVRPISWYLWYSRSSAYRRLMMARSGTRAQRTHVTATRRRVSSILRFVP